MEEASPVTGAVSMRGQEASPVTGGGSAAASSVAAHLRPRCDRPTASTAPSGSSISGGSSGATLPFHFLNKMPSSWCFFASPTTVALSPAHLNWPHAFSKNIGLLRPFMAVSTQAHSKGFTRGALITSLLKALGRDPEARFRRRRTSVGGDMKNHKLFTTKITTKKKWLKVCVLPLSLWSTLAAPTPF